MAFLLAFALAAAVGVVAHAAVLAAGALVEKFAFAGLQNAAPKHHLVDYDF
jgi:hypothetical protein